MTAIEAVSSYLPASSQSVAEHLDRVGLREDLASYERYYGFGQVRADPGVGIAEQLRAAAAGLPDLTEQSANIRYLVYAPTIQATARYPGTPLRSVCQQLGLSRVLPFSLTQHACASALLAIDVCGRLLAADGDPDARAIVLAGEKTFTSESLVLPASAVMGEGTAAVLVSAHGSRDRVLSYAVHTLGEFHQAPFQQVVAEQRFQAQYPAALASVIADAVAKAGLAMSEIAFILPHNVNRMSWLRIMKELGLPKDRIVLDNQRALGHCFGADPFINYQTVQRDGRLRPGDRYVMTAAGLGATLSAMVFQN